jgi:hypothetical protein
MGRRQRDKNYLRRRGTDAAGHATDAEARFAGALAVEVFEAVDPAVFVNALRMHIPARM